MEDNKLDESPGKPPPDYFDYKKKEELKEEFIKDLEENPKYKSFFEQYNAVSVKQFIETYAAGKAEDVVSGQYYINKIESYQAMFTEMAKSQLWEIQQRKLFDLQCYWRAEQIKIPEITIANDFVYWSQRIAQCPFLSPIAPEEFERYLQYMRVTKLEDIYAFVYDWQNYASFKIDYENDEEDALLGLPCWYSYYENVTGLASLFLLPDIRGEKEERYMQAAEDEDKRAAREKNKNNPAVVDRRPHFSYYDAETLNKFMTDFEEFKIRYAHECRKKYEANESDSALDEAIKTLKFADEPIYPDPNLDWRAGIIDAADNYTKQKIIEALPGVYENYLFRVKTGLAFELVKTRRMDKVDRAGKILRELILKGRELLGEPRDFNF